MEPDKSNTEPAYPEFDTITRPHNDPAAVLRLETLYKVILGFMEKVWHKPVTVPQVCHKGIKVILSMRRGTGGLV